MNPNPPANPFPSRPPEGSDALTELAMDLRWTWNHCSDELWQRLDPALWETTRHPSVVLQTVAHDRLAASLADPGFCKLLEDLVIDRKSTRLNSSHLGISYAVFSLKKKKKSTLTTAHGRSHPQRKIDTARHH